MYIKYEFLRSIHINIVPVPAVIRPKFTFLKAEDLSKVIP